MRVRAPFDYAVVRLVPRVERDEFVNAGVILRCIAHDFLGARVGLAPSQLARCLPEPGDRDLVVRHLEAVARVARGDADAGPVARMSLRERWHWLVAPRSSVLQTGPVHVGLCQQPEAELARLFARLVDPCAPVPPSPA